MDELKIESKPSCWAASKFIRFLVRKKLGYDIEVDLGKFRTTIIDEKVHVEVNVDLDMSPEEFKKLKNRIGL